MLIPTHAARSFSEFLPGQTPAAAEDSARLQQAQWTDASDQLSYFDAIMRLRSRRPISRRRRFLQN